jgi:hypothetical protein
MPAGAAVHGEASLDVRAHASDDSTTLQVYEARGSLQAALSRQWELYADGGVRHGNGVIDESYVGYRSAGTRVRLGRFFVPIGIHSRSELYYSGFVNYPFVKYYPFRGFQLYRSDQGIALAGGSSRLSYEVSVLGADGSSGLLGLEDPQDITLRLQGYSGRLILGLNGYAGTTRVPLPGGGAEGRAVRLAGLDWRYSTPGWIVRGEWWTGQSGGRALDGGYLDLIYHPAIWPAWTFVFRGDLAYWALTFHAVTLGTRFVPARGWAVQVNWVATDPDYSTKGLHLQVLRSVEF